MPMRLPSIFLAALISFALFPCSVLAQDTAAQVENPRPFGYVVGDLLERRVKLSAIPAKETLPQPGRVDDWLELRQVEINGRDVAFTYQLMNAPAEVKTLQLPPLTLDAGDSRVAIAEWPFTAAPITPPFVLAREGLSEIRADTPPQIIATRGAELRLLLYALGLAALMLWWGYEKFAWRISDRPFSRAYRELRSLEEGDGAYRRALKIVHRAFDEAAGRALFAQELPGFFAKHPRFEAAAADTHKFFSLSEQEFFTANRSERAIGWIISFCRNLSRLEVR